VECVLDAPLCPMTRLDLDSKRFMIVTGPTGRQIDLPRQTALIVLMA
jgi:hypothetical protein